MGTLWIRRTAVRVALIVLALLAGCGKETHEDVSAEPRSREIIGTRYEVIGQVHAHGIRPHSQAPVEHVVLLPPPGIAGTMIAWREPVRKGSIITVRKVVRTNRLFDGNMNLDVDLEGTPLPVSAPVTVQLMRENKGEGYLQPNPAVFRKLPPT
jgi:hypothetical protein